MTDLTWTASDLDTAASESGVVHESVTNTDHNSDAVLKQGYSIASPYRSADLVGLWALQEDAGSTAYDFSATSNNASINGATVNQTGILGTTSHGLDGTDDYLQAGQHNYGIADGTASPFTLTAWVYWDGSTDTSQGIFQSQEPPSGSPPANPPIMMSLGGSNNNKLQVAIQDSGNNANLARDSNTFPSGQWVFVAGSYDGSTIRAYRNATEVATGSAADIYNGTTQPEIGVWKRASGRYWSGRIADVRLYTAQLAASDLQTLYDVVATQGTLTTAGQTA